MRQEEVEIGLLTRRSLLLHKPGFFLFFFLAFELTAIHLSLHMLP
jgi:hypothetical protein